MISGFRWIIDGKLAGSALPGLYGDHEKEIKFLKSCNVSHIVSLLEEEVSDQFGDDFFYYHFPIEDMKVPNALQAKKVLKQVRSWIENDQVVLFHCKAGLGRTGTMLACYMIDEGMTADEALEHVRRINPSYIQSDIQERFLRQYAILP